MFYNITIKENDTYQQEIEIDVFQFKELT
jgi:hypothetical protein